MHKMSNKVNSNEKPSYSFQNLVDEFNEVDEEQRWSRIFENIQRKSRRSDLKVYSGPPGQFGKYNRYSNIIPFEHSRIKLKQASVDYINANLVKSQFIDQKYIIAMGPLENTIEHFWHMVWENKSKGVIMLCNLREENKEKCALYYPSADEENGLPTLELGSSFFLNYIREESFNGFSIRTIELENLNSKETREIFHCHFTSWGDFGMPENVSAILSLINECQKRCVFSDIFGPPVIHCSAGVGRSGSLALIHSMIQLYKKYEDEMPCDVISMLEELRTHRNWLVQTPEQLRYSYEAVIDGINQYLHEKKEVKNDEKVEGVENEEDENEHQEEEEEDEEDESDEEEDEADSEETRKNIRRRPDTAFSKRNSKRFKASRKIENRVKNLRQLQKQNAEKSNSSSDDEVEIKTAIERPLISSEKAKHSDLDDENSSEQQEEEDEEFAFTRDVQTVKVNEARRPLKDDQTKNEPNLEPNGKSNLLVENKIFQRKIENASTNETNPNNSSTSSPANRTKSLSDKEKRIAEQVKLMKQKQLKHEHNKAIVKKLKPVLICGGILVGSLFIFQIYKKMLFFSE